MKFLFLLFIIFTLNTSAAQTGVINYGQKESMGLGAPIGADYNSMLVFDKENSLYVTRKDSLEGGHLKEQKRFPKEHGGSSSITVVTNPEGFLYYHDPQNKTLYSRDLGFRYVKDTTIDIPWKISAETKKIGNFTVQKATGPFRGRDYTAWFTTEIPLPYGPWKLSGLPGMILEAYDNHKEIYWYFKNIEYPSEKGYLLKSIEAPNNKWWSLEDFKKFSVKTYLDAQMAGRVVAESAGFSGGTSSYNMGKSRIEAFEIEE